MTIGWKRYAAYEILDKGNQIFADKKVSTNPVLDEQKQSHITFLTKSSTHTVKYIDSIYSFPTPPQKAMASTGDHDFHPSKSWTRGRERGKIGEGQHSPLRRSNWG